MDEEKLVDVEKEKLSAKKKLIKKKIYKKEEVEFNKQAGLITDKRWLAKFFIKHQPIFYSKERYWWLWNFKNYCWEIIDEVDLINEFDKIMNAPLVTDTKFRNELIECIKQESRKNKPEEPKRTWIQFLDKIIDIETEKEFIPTAKYFIANPIPWKIGDNEETPKIDKLVSDWVVSKEEGNKWVNTVFEVIAYCLLSDYPIHIAITLLGKGRNGKGTFQELIERFVGSRNYTTVNFKNIISNNFEIWSMYKKLVCLVGEMNANILKDTDTFKRLTGRDTMKFVKKYHDGIEGKNYAKLIISANQLPETYDKSEGFYRRQLIIDFPNNFKEVPNFLDKTIPDVEYSNLSKKCIRILKELLKKGEFTNQGEVAERVKRYEERANPFTNFIEECCDEGFEYDIPFWKLFESYMDYLKQRNFRLQSKVEFGRLIRSKGYIVSSPKPVTLNIGKTNEKDTSWVFVNGLRLKDIYEETYDEKTGKIYSRNGENGVE